VSERVNSERASAVIAVVGGAAAAVNVRRLESERASERALLLPSSVLRNDLLPPRYSVCGLRRFRLPAEVPAEFCLDVRY